MAPYETAAELYDAIYSFKDYDEEAGYVHAIIEAHKHSAGTALLDIGCGTGGHLAFLKQHYTVEGLDLSGAMLAVARKRYPDVTFHHGDMTDFDLGKTYDIVISLFSAIGYAKTRERLFHTLQAIARHTASGGVVIVEPWLTPDRFIPHHTGANFVDHPDLKVARMNTSELTDEAWVVHFQYLVARDGMVQHFEEQHEMGLFTDADYRDAFRAAGLTVSHDPKGPTGRGLYIGTKAAP